MGKSGHVDFSVELREESDWYVGALKTIDHLLDVAAFAVDPVSSIFAVGTLGGSIRIFGAPGVETGVTLSTPTPVKFLQFATNIFKLVAIDEKDTLYIWDLTSQGQIKLEVTFHLGLPATCITLSPSHTHAYIGFESGEVKTYDLLCRRLSAYSIPNAWELYEQELVGGGNFVDTTGTSRLPVDVVIHPRNLNLVFIAYGGGVVLIDLKNRNTLRTYELLIPAGAPGGAGYTDPDLMNHRRPSVISMSIHPSGHFFVVGHIDGSIAFWAVEDDDQPLLVRTLDDIDVHLLDMNNLEKHLPNEEGSEKKSAARHEPREPVFKLAWSGYPNSSDPRGGETSLVILGGQFHGDPPGLNVLWLPPYNPPAPPAPGPAEGLHPFFRKAMRASLDPLDAHFGHTPGIVQDFLLIPRENPHFAGTWDPKAILILFEGEEQTRGIEAYCFPPSAFLAPSDEPAKAPATDADEVDKQDAVAQDLESTLQSMKLHAEPEKLALHPELWSGPNAVMQASLVSLDRIAYDALVGPSPDDPKELRLEGGIAVPAEDIANEIRFAKFEPFRFLVTQHGDLTVRFTDLSVQLIIPSPTSPFTSACPRILPALTIDVLESLGHPTIACSLRPGFVDQARVDLVSFTNEALEVAIALTSGELFVYRLRAQPPYDAVQRNLPDKQLVSLEHLQVARGLRFKPFFMITASSPLSTFAMSDIGFVATAYMDGALSIVDMRGPRILLHADAEAQKPRHRPLQIHKSPTVDPISCLTWTICNLKSDSVPRIRLLACHVSGLTRIYTLMRDSHGMWSVRDAPQEVETTAAPLSAGTFVLDAQTGAPCKADKNRLAVALASSQSPAKEDSDSAAKCLLIVAGAKGVRCFDDLGDGKVSRSEWGSKAGQITTVQVIEKNGSYALVALNDRHEALIYSLPTLEYLHTFTLPTPTPLTPTLDPSGDFLSLTPLHPPRQPSVRSLSPPPAAKRSLSPAPSLSSVASLVSRAAPAYERPARSIVRNIHLDTLFNVRRGYHTPVVSLTERTSGAGPSMPPQPQPVELGPAGWLSTAGSWLGGLGVAAMGSVSGDQIDALLAGPDRPVPAKPAPRAGPGKFTEWDASTTSKSASRTQNTLYDRLHAAVAERGEMLGELENRFNSLEEGSKSMVEQAKRLAVTQTAKGWLSFR
ncbi:hypothetical protein BV25DRAFT_1918512 [Artomyces pyxidatus]|uniref:Uncharacterized protein n=1 Tax=Artomyces pyxidatus TaxID=48021 RepID=A0ACB8STD3_9AGAM|nr:hypothetical protein BV25DRAFT_1918512 [Artomyces pyxidatus]